VEAIKNLYYRYLRYHLAKDEPTATNQDKYLALSYAVRSEMMDRWIETQKRYHENNVRRVYFLSLEYLLGKNLKNNVINLDLQDSVAEAAQSLGFSLDSIFDQEDDFEIGNGGKGRLAASYQDAMATAGIPAIGYGLRYDYALFRQRIEEGKQVERPYDWAHKGHPWEIVRPEYACSVGFYGAAQPMEKNGSFASPAFWQASDEVAAVPFDVPIPGFRSETVNTLRLWSARASEEFLKDYVRACDEKSKSGRITRLLLPDEDIRRASDLRLKQQYFFVSASLQDILRRFKAHNADVADLPNKVAIQLSGSSCSIAVAELMRLLVDVEGLGWEVAWEVTRRTFSYTSHAISRENLESWPVYLMEQILPRHLQIIYEINARHLQSIRTSGLGPEAIRELSVVEEGEVKRIRMAHLAVLGSSALNGVSTVHTNMLQNRIFGDFLPHVHTPVFNITNGVAYRRWLASANAPLASLITEAIGDKWLREPAELCALEKFVDDEQFLFRLGDLKHAAKRKLGEVLQRCCDFELDSSAFVDVQAKKIHPYKRQVLNVLNILDRFLRIRDGEDPAGYRVHVFAGRAMPADHMGKQIIHLIHIVADAVNRELLTENRLRVLFVPNFGVSLAECLVPAADLTEEIAAPGLEACGTTNMKFASNGAIAMASRAGANLDMERIIGSENIFLFGRNGDEARSSIQPHEMIAQNPRLQSIFKVLEEEVLPAAKDGDMVYPLLASLRDKDPFGVLIDFDSYHQQQDAVDQCYRNHRQWLAMSLRNIARIGYFTSDRAVREYAREIWKVI
jgi:starch phosphorylase